MNQILELFEALSHPFVIQHEHHSVADPGQRDPCVVAAMDKLEWTTDILWRKGTAWPLFK